MGGFIQPDSIVPDPFEPAAWNRYGYVYGNPVNYTDPSGHCVFGLDTAVCIVAGIGLAAGAFGGHLAATSAGYEVGSPQWYGAVATGGVFGGISGGLGYAGYGLGAFALAVTGDTIVDAAILGGDFGPSLARNFAYNLAFDGLGYAVGRGFRYLRTRNIPTTVVHRFATRSNIETLKPNLSRANKFTQARIKFLMLFPKYRRWRAHRHMSGDVKDSPFVSVLLDPLGGPNTPDRWLRTIATGSPGVPGVRRAPDLGTFTVPSHRLIGPEPHNSLSILETEMVFWGSDLANYLDFWQNNPF